MTSADLVLLNGNIITMNPKIPSAQAIAVKGNRISCVGNNQEVSQYINEKTQVVYLDGKTVIPGFIDTHTHVVDYGRMLTWLDLQEVSSIREAQIQLSERIKCAMDGNEWVLGRALDPDGLLEKRLPTCQELDTVAPDNPVVIYCQLGQVCVVNSKALKAARIGQQNNVGIEKDTTGNPTGVLRNQATDLVWGVIPESTQQELHNATELALEKIVQAGITSVHWIVLSEEELSIIQNLVETDGLPLRVYLIVPTNLLDLALQNLKPLENDYFKLGGAIIFIDGYLASRTAALFEPYSDAPTEQGKLFCRQNEGVVLANKIQDAGLQLIIHAVGDKAIQEALNIIQHVKRNSVAPCPRIEQAAILNHQLLCSIKELGVSVSIQPCVVASEFSVWSAEDHLGKKRARWLFPVKELLSKGVLVSAGSDCPMEPLNPLRGIEAAVKREGIQKVSVFEALQMYTVFAAQAVSEFADKGSIEPNKFADLVVLSKDPVSVEAEAGVSVSVCFTVFGGTVYCSKN
ncbi:MAG: amidohydrolase [Nitrososphaerota archaeon]|jgi:predicted amidohydrolase YtcJ|nr:amidohydrolase [Nitrososphaerota archaeon]